MTALVPRGPIGFRIAGSTGNDRAGSASAVRASRAAASALSTQVERQSHRVRRGQAIRRAPVALRVEVDRLDHIVRSGTRPAQAEFTLAVESLLPFSRRKSLATKSLAGSGSCCSGITHARRDAAWRRPRVAKWYNCRSGNAGARHAPAYSTSTSCSATCSARARRPCASCACPSGARTARGASTRTC
jgi:hypothetical protein